MPQIIGLKDATGDATRPLRLRSLIRPGFRLLSGDDASALAFLAHGGDGCISTTSNVAPGICRAMYLAWKQGQIARAQRLAAAAAPLTAALSRESDPVPVKYALSIMNMVSPRVRLPLVQLTRATMAEVDGAAGTEGLRTARPNGSARPGYQVSPSFGRSGAAQYATSPCSDRGCNTGRRYRNVIKAQPVLPLLRLRAIIRLDYSGGFAPHLYGIPIKT
jgi:hypothetical protein